MQTAEPENNGVRSRILGASFSQDQKCFAIAHESGFKVYNTDPMEAWVSRDLSGGILSASMLDRTNYLALVGGGSKPRFPSSMAIIWDDLKEKVAITLEFLLPVRKVLLSRNNIVVVQVNKVHVYNFASPPKLLGSFDTSPNHTGIAALNGNTLAILGLASGCVQIIDLSSQQCRVQSFVRAHKAPIQALALSRNMLASASTTGTIIRIHEISSTLLLHEYRRGLDKALVHSMAFQEEARLAVLSDKSTLHVFELNGGKNRTHSLRNFPLAPQFFKNEWSFVSCLTRNAGPGVVGWTSSDSLIILWTQAARWEKYVVLAQTQELIRESWRRIDV